MTEGSNTKQYAALESKLNEIIQAVSADLNKGHKALIEKASAMEDVRTYTQLTDFCYEQVGALIDNKEKLMQILTDPKSIEEMYETLSEQEEFKEICAEEYKGFPRVVLMAILAGADAMAADHGAALLEKEDPEESTRLLELSALYQKYAKEASAYGKGERKNVVFTGEHSA